MTPSLTFRLRSALRGLIGRSAWLPFARVPTDEPSGTKLGNPYEQSAWVQRAIKLIAGPVASAPLYWYADNGGEEGELADAGLSQFLRAPARGLSWPLFIEASIGWRKLAGECFWLIDDSVLVPFPAGRATAPPLILARPDRMRVVAPRGELLGWQYLDGAGATHSLLPDQVIHLRLWNPYSEHRGLPELAAAQTAAEADYLAGNYLRNLMRNSGDQGPYVWSKVPLEEQQQKQIEAALRQKRDLASRGIFKAAFFSNEIDVKSPTTTVPDAGFVLNRVASRHEIAIALGIPPSLFDVKASYSVGSASDFFMLLTNSCLPEARALAAGLSLYAERLLGRPVRAEFDFDEHPTMQQVRAERMAQAVQLWDRGMSWQAVSEYLSLGMVEFEGWDIPYVPFSAQPVDGAETLADFDEVAQTPPDAVKVMLRALRARKCAAQLDCDCCALELRADSPAGYKAHVTHRRVTVRAYEAKFKRALLEARAETLRNLERAGERAIEQRGVAADFIFDLARWKLGLKATMRRAGATALQRAGQQLFSEVAKDDPFNMPPPAALEFLRARENRFEDIANDVHRSVMSALEDGLERGDTMADLAAAVREEFNGFDAARSKRIAMTETAAAYGVARQEAMNQSGVERKKWLTSNAKGSVRPAHWAAEGQVRPVAEPFDVGGEALMYPGDPEGSPGNVINCHCVSIATTDDLTD